MNLNKSLFLVGSILAAAFPLAASAQLNYNISADAGNSTGVFGFFDPQPYFATGDIALPANTVIGSTPLEVDLNLSHNVTLDNSGHYAWFLNYGADLPFGGDLGQLDFKLLLNGTAVTPLVGFDAGPNTFINPVTQFGTGNNDLTAGVTFNQIDVFIQNSNPGGEPLTDVMLDLNATVPDTASTLALLFMGTAALFIAAQMQKRAARN